MYTRPRILIVEDDLELAELTTLYLLDHGYDVFTATNGLLALDQLGRQRFDLAIVDLMLPRMSGMELMERMRQSPSFAAVPIIVTTAMPEMLGAARHRLHDVLLRKPFRPAALLRAVEELLPGPPRRA